MRGWFFVAAALAGALWPLAGCDSAAPVAGDDDDSTTGTNAGGMGGEAGQGGVAGSGPLVPPGCERSALDSACSGAPGIVESRVIDIGGAQRTYRVFAPTTAGCTAPSGILFFFHGLGGGETNFNALDSLAESANLLFVQPRGSPQSWAQNALGWVPDGFADNIALVRAIRAELENAYAVDPYRVYIAGFSQGAFMAAAAASPAALGNEVTGVGIFGGGEEANTCPAASCYQPLTCKIPFFMRTGNMDQHLPYQQDLHQGLLGAGWPLTQLDVGTFPGGHTINEPDVVAMVAWLDVAYPKL